ncbi:hypothetical protein Slin15195_G128510 [Septoria linicola]|uniref:Uncharacterized protein n=1 Tax=Septoria linicola TaxID=215465 RepID=A0A9Q9B921_9PEZI|nr:hypothetical protein Slin14017_G084660 [Septoria linicola]USW59532.1 hypothetical protein Slin15195_G128510 [Septoria linicola]
MEGLNREMSTLYRAIALKTLFQNTPCTRSDAGLNVIDEADGSEDGEGITRDDLQLVMARPNDPFATRFRLSVPSPADMRWCGFLDALCVLCWFGQGGESVVSIGAQQQLDGKIKFILTTNDGSILKPVKHFKDVLALLSCFLCGELDEPATINEVAKRSITLAKDKILNYRSRLRSQLALLRQDQAQYDSESEALLDTLGQWLPQRQFDRYLLCQRAYDFRGSQQDRLLAIKASTDIKTYRIIRHYMGRLGSYHAAASVVVEGADEFAGTIRGATVGWIEASSTLSRSTAFTVGNDIATLVTTACPRLRHFQGRTAEVVARLEGATSLLHDYRTVAQKPVVHAEAAMAHHFHRKQLQFARGLRYIGCSKASCYLCDLYFSRHPAGFIRRSCSGRAWLRWELPRTNPPSLRQDESLENLRIIRDMLDAIHHDLDNDIDGGRYGMKAEFDSTTGMSIPLSTA